MRRKTSLPYFFHGLGDALLAEIDGADHGPHVAIVLARRAGVGQQQLPHLVHIFSGLFYFYRRHPQTLMEDLGGLAAEGAGHHAADLGHMADADGEAHQLALDEEGLEEGVLGAVQAAPIGVVVEDDVARLERVKRDLLGAGLYQERHPTDHGRAELGAGDHVALGVGQGAGKIEALVEDRRVGRLHEENAHLAADRDHGRIDDVHGHEVGWCRARPERPVLLLDRHGRLDDRQARLDLARIAPASPLDAPLGTIDASLAVAGAGDARPIDQHPAGPALDVFLDVVAIVRKAHRSGLPQLCAASISRWPHGSTWSCWPGLTTVTEAASSTTAGPMMAWPARRAARS